MTDDLVYKVITNLFISLSVKTLKKRKMELASKSELPPKP